MRNSNKIFTVGCLCSTLSLCTIASVGIASLSSAYSLNSKKEKQIDDPKIIPTDYFNINSGVLSGFKSTVKFQDLANYNTLRIPDGVKEIKANAFSNMFDQFFTILKLELNADLEIIGDAAFLNCYAFGAPARSTIDFKNCTKLKSIGIDAFSGCEVIGDENREIDLSACTQLTNIGSSAFRYGQFKSLKLPNTLIDVGALAFSNCTELKTIDFSLIDTIPNWMYNSRNLFNNVVEQQSTITDRKVCVDCSKFTLNEWKDVFSRQNLPFNTGTTTTNFDIEISTKLDISDERYFQHGPKTEYGITITGITEDGKAELAKATTLFIGKDVYAIDDSVNFKDLIVPNNNRKSVSLIFDSPQTSNFTKLSKGVVGSNAKGCFMGCTALSGKIVFPRNLQTLPKNAFNGCSGITELDFSNVILRGLSKEDSFTFDTSCCEGCSKLRKVIFPNLITEIYFQKKSFKDDKHLSIFDFSGSAQCSLSRGSEIDGSQTVQANEWPFYNVCEYGRVVASNNTLGFLSKLVNMFELKAGNEVIGTTDYENWKYTIPAPEISFNFEDYATTGNSILFGFKKDKIDSISSINCVAIPKSILKIYDNSFDNVLFASKTDTEWYKWTLNLNNGLQTIGNRAFANGCHLIGNLDIPNTVTSIGNEAFFKCSGFTGEFNLPNHITSIGDKAFSGCKNLWNSELVIPDSVQHIGSYAFADMNLVKGIKFMPPNNSIHLSAFAFGEMLNLNTIDLRELTLDQCKSVIENADTLAFSTNRSSTAGKGKVLVPSGSISELKPLLEDKGLDTTYQWNISE